ncbi:hypothetical protein [Sorangium sp. So ce385]|uniref:hypothetical protein n=1 Tax=Sorangium sp. So ce385 TaxID=3133308 RepID=UPI003F5C6700
MTSKIITALAVLSLFVGMALAHATAPAASGLKARSVLGAEASAATPETVAFYGSPAADVATTTQVDPAGIAIGASGVVSQAAVAPAGGIGNIGVSTTNAQGFQGGGYGAWRSIAMNGAPACGRADVLFDK